MTPPVLLPPALMPLLLVLVALEAVAAAGDRAADLKWYRRWSAEAIASFREDPVRFLHNVTWAAGMACIFIFATVQTVQDFAKKPHKRRILFVRGRESARKARRKQEREARTLAALERQLGDLKAKAFTVSEELAALGHGGDDADIHKAAYADATAAKKERRQIGRNKNNKKTKRHGGDDALLHLDKSQAFPSIQATLVKKPVWRKKVPKKPPMVHQPIGKMEDEVVNYSPMRGMNLFGGYGDVATNVSVVDPGVSTMGDSKSTSSVDGATANGRGNPRGNASLAEGRYVPPPQGGDESEIVVAIPTAMAAPMTMATQLAMAAATLFSAATLITMVFPIAATTTIAAGTPIATPTWITMAPSIALATPIPTATPFPTVSFDEKSAEGAAWNGRTCF